MIINQGSVRSLKNPLCVFRHRIVYYWTAVVGYQLLRNMQKETTYQKNSMVVREVI